MTLVNVKDIKFTPIGSTGPGGQNVNKTSTGVRAVHEPSGIVVVIRTRSLVGSKRKAVEEIRNRLNLEKKAAGDRFRKARWKQAISDRKIVRSYNYARNEVKDHRTGARANLKDVLNGDIGLLQTMMYFEVPRRAELEKEMPA